MMLQIKDTIVINIRAWMMIFLNFSRELLSSTNEQTSGFPVKFAYRLCLTKNERVSFFCFANNLHRRWQNLQQIVTTARNKHSVRLLTLRDTVAPSQLFLIDTKPISLFSNNLILQLKNLRIIFGESKKVGSSTSPNLNTDDVKIQLFVLKSSYFLFFIEKKCYFLESLIFSKIQFCIKLASNNVNVITIELWFIDILTK